MNRFTDSGGSIGTWATAELQREQLEPMLKALEQELAQSGNSPAAQVGPRLPCSTCYACASHPPGRPSSPPMARRRWPRKPSP